MTPAEFRGEVSCRGAHDAFGAVHMIRQPDHEQRRTPFAQQRRQCIPGRSGDRIDDPRERSSAAAQRVPARHSDPFSTIIERQDELGRIQALPLMGLMRDNSTPSKRPADCHLTSNGKSKMIDESTGAFSQALAFISSSSWPPSQPA